MEKISTDFVYEFAKDLKKLLETLESEYGKNLARINSAMKERMQKSANVLVKELYEKYKNLLDLKLCNEDEKYNFAIEDSSNTKILIY